MGNRRRARRAIPALGPDGWGTGVLTGTGVGYEAAHTFGADPAAGVADGEHAWSIVVTYRIADPAAFTREQQHLDMENVTSTMGPLCFKCEQGYEPGVTPVRCPGQPPGELRYV